MRALYYYLSDTVYLWFARRRHPEYLAEAMRRHPSYTVLDVLSDDATIDLS